MFLYAPSSMSVYIRGVRFGYSADRIVLRDIDLEVGSGETVAVVGASGCGKSTLLRLISGALRRNRAFPYEGTILISSDETTDSLRKSGRLGFMFQEPALFPNLSVERNICMPLQILGIRSQYKDLVEFLIDRVGLREYKDYLPGQLSGGMRTRVSIARTFATRPSLLLLDEPFSALDIGWKLSLYRALSDLRENSGATTILVTHDIQEALLLSQHVVVLSKFGYIIKDIKNPTQRPPVLAPEAVRSYLKDVYDVYLQIQEAILLDNDKIAPDGSLDSLSKRINSVG
jgi:ABC-type nitrate/sulfonate/bicarbonate transport system ATPase subunit